MEYRLVFDVADRIPDIALGIAALVVLVLVIAAGLLEFEALLATWRLVAAGAIALGLLLAFSHRTPADLPFVALPVLFIIAELLRDRFPSLDSTRLPRGGGPLLFGTFLLLFVALSGIAEVGAIGLTNQLRRGGAEQLEGRVTDFFEVGFGKNECFTVSGRRFCYSDSVSSAGFNRTRGLGGPIGPGVQVRLAAIGDTIVRLEVASAP